MRYRKYLIIGIIIAIASVLMRPAKDNNSRRDYADIKSEGVLRVAIGYGPTSLHVNDEGDMEGFHYQLVKQFAETHGLTLEIIPETDLQKQDKLLEEGACDLIASGRPLTLYDDSILRHTHPITVDRQIIIQRKEEMSDTLCPHLKSQIDLAGRELCIPQGSPAKQRIHHLMEEIGDSIHIKEIPQYGSEQLMALVAHGDICYAVCEEHVVKAHIHQYPQLDTSLPVSLNQFYSWIVSAQSPALLDSLNAWIIENGEIKGNRRR